MLLSEEMGLIGQALNQGVTLQPVNADDLKLAWARFAPYREQACRPFEPSTIEEMIGSFPDIPSVFFRCVLLDILEQQGTPLSDAVFERVAALALNLESIAALTGQQLPRRPGT